VWILYIGDRRGGREDVMTSLCVENSMGCGCERIYVYQGMTLMSDGWPAAGGWGFVT